MRINFEVIQILRQIKKAAAVYLLLCQDRPLRVVAVARLFAYRTCPNYGEYPCMGRD